MQLRITPPSVRTASAGLRHSFSAVLSGMTAVGTFTAVILNSDYVKSSIIQAIGPVKDAILNDFLLKGIEKAKDKLHSWGSAIIATKDDFKVWLNNYLGPDGFKSGLDELYRKLYGWGEIVYAWFRDKFILFIKNIPKIVENWKQIRLSLFKWGTFIGGGGGSALWAMFGTGDNWGKLAELMGNEDFMGAVEKFADLVDKNQEAFKDMGQEAMQEILEKIMEDPKDAKDIAEELLKEQEEKNKDKKEGEEKQELEQEKIKESFANPKGSPKSQEEVFGYLVGDTLESLIKSHSSFDSPLSSAKDTAEKAMKAYMEKIKQEATKKTKAGKANKDFIDALGDKGEDLIKELAEIASLAMGKGHRNFGDLAKAFETIMKDKYTVPVEGDGGEEGVSLDDIIKAPKRKEQK